MSRSRWIYIAGRAIPAHEYTPEPSADFHVMPDIAPYTSMIDGSIIASRSAHRQHLRDHNCVEVGNDSSLYGKPKPLQSPPGLKEEIIRATNEIEERDRRKRRN